MRSDRLAAAALALAACGGDPDVCDAGWIRDGDTCVPYVPDDPATGPDRAAFPSGLTWQWQLTGQIDTGWDVAVYDVDLFDVPDAVFSALHDADRLVVCYFSAGSWEEWRDDAGAFPTDAIGNVLDGWPDERWLDITRDDVRGIMEDRLDLAVARGCDGVEPDNVTAWDTDSGFGISRTEQLEYNRFLADAAHARGLAIALKNDVEQIRDLVDWFDFAVNEECAAYDECDRNGPFVDADKAVLHAEYVDRWADAQAMADQVCGISPGLSTIVKTWDLGPERLACDQPVSARGS